MKHIMTGVAAIAAAGFLSGCSPSIRSGAVGAADMPTAVSPARDGQVLLTSVSDWRRTASEIAAELVRKVPDLSVTDLRTDARTATMLAFSDQLAGALLDAGVQVSLSPTTSSLVVRVVPVFHAADGAEMPSGAVGLGETRAAPRAEAAIHVVLLRAGREVAAVDRSVYVLDSRAGEIGAMDPSVAPLVRMGNITREER